ncbi:MAG: ubiquinone/menaquinone biosynthesis methyltransferase [Akkermansiaceae bacterium]|nr:ubiquinone/menaquinone biosynthesis methyltransferase [Akkermansiaceae bacterium]
MQKTREALRRPESKRDLNRALFDRIAGRYNLATRALSLGRDAAWKKELVEALPVEQPATCLDLASGTGDFAALLADRYPGARIVGLDLSSRMVALARKRLPGARFEFHCGDIGSMPFDDDFADLVTGGYALRNVPDLARALAEIHRVLKPGGSAFFLEFVQPPPGYRRAIHHAILHLWGGLVGLVLHFGPSTYRYIPESLVSYPAGDDLRKMFIESGFTIVNQRRHFFGMTERIELRKPHP